MNLVMNIAILLLTLFVGVQVNAATIQLPKTGQTHSFAVGDDGAMQKGAVWPNPRFTDNGNGTVSDNLTGLIWLKNANCSANLGGINNTGTGLFWPYPMTWANALASGACGLSDGSTAGQWRLPNIIELESLVDASKYSPALPAGHPFTGVQSVIYWSSSSLAHNTIYAWFVSMLDGSVSYGDETYLGLVWPVRSGQ